MAYQKFISRKIPPISSTKLCFVRILVGISSLIKIIIPPPFLFLSNLNGIEKSGKWEKCYLTLFEDTILFASFIRTDFHYLRDKTDGFINFSWWLFPLSNFSVLLGCQSSQILFKKFTQNPYSDGKKLFNNLKYFWIIKMGHHLWDEYHLSIPMNIFVAYKSKTVSLA